MKKLSIFLLILLCASWAFAQGDIKTDFSGVIKWDSAIINAQVSLDLASAGVKLPAGRTYGESLLKDAYLNMMRPYLLSLQFDSSSTISDLVNRGELTLAEVDALALGAVSKAPSLSPDMRHITSSHSIPLSKIKSAFLRHSRPSPITRTLNPVSTAQYTGIIIIAAETLPVHGMKKSALAVPCIFPKIWDSEMNLIYEYQMLEIDNARMVTYSSAENIFKRDNPSGLSKELLEIVGEKPLRIFAQGVFGSKPTDLIIDKSDALLIISSEENRRLLSQGRVVFILDDAVLENKIAE